MPRTYLRSDEIREVRGEIGDGDQTERSEKRDQW
jgi:hypothetical protein